MDAQGDGFNTTLSYRWLLPGVMLEATNLVHGADGAELARYSGAYMWDAGRREVVFHTASGSGEVHRGRAWSRDGVLWHEAEVSGGGIASYASAMRHGDDGRLEYFAAYDRSDAGDYLLATTPIVYTRPSHASIPDDIEPEHVDAPISALAFMAGCWRGECSDGAALEEYYSTPSPNLIVGVSRFLRDGRAVQHEFSRITADSTGVVLLPFPGGRASEHAFRLTHNNDDTALFEAPEHDFPKRIRYTRAPDGSLTAHIDGGEGDVRVQEWRMLPVACSGQ